MYTLGEVTTHRFVSHTISRFRHEPAEKPKQAPSALVSADTRNFQPFSQEECNDDRDPKADTMRRANLVMQQSDCDRATALRCLEECDYDLVGATIKALDY